MRNNFEAAASFLIGVDPYERSQRHTPNDKGEKVSTIGFSVGHGSTGTCAGTIQVNLKH